MGRVQKKAPVAAVKEMEDSPTVTQSRARRTPKPNPKYANDSIIATPKVESDTPDGSSDLDEKPVEPKPTKSVKKSASVPVKKAVVKSKAVKKQKLDYDDADELTDDADEKPDEKPPARPSRGKIEKDTLKLGDESVAIVDVSSIISKSPVVKPDSPKPSRAVTRKRPGQDDVATEELTKKKKEEESKSMITARKSYIPASKSEEAKKEEPQEKKGTPAAIRPRRGAAAESPQETVEKKTPIVVKGLRSPITSPIKSPVLPTKLVNNNNNLKTVIAGNSPKPLPRILNSMVTPKDKQSPNVKLAGDGKDKKVFSIDLTDDSIKEKVVVGSPIKVLPKLSAAVKENVALNKPQPAALLKNKLESELIRMKAANNLARRVALPTAVQPNRIIQNNSSPSVAGARRITKFESWYVIDVKNQEPGPFRHTHTFSLIKLGNNIKEVKLPSSKWDFRVNLQKRRENNSEKEVYTGEIYDKMQETDKSKLEPSSILFKRNQGENKKIVIDRSLMVKQGAYVITMNGKQCRLIGAPDDIKSLEDLEILISIIDSCSLDHSCVEPAPQQELVKVP